MKINSNFPFNIFYFGQLSCEMFLQSFTLNSNPNWTALWVYNPLLISPFNQRHILIRTWVRIISRHNNNPMFSSYKLVSRVKGEEDLAGVDLKETRWNKLLTKSSVSSPYPSLTGTLSRPAGQALVQSSSELEVLEFIILHF